LETAGGVPLCFSGFWRLRKKIVQKGRKSDNRTKTHREKKYHKFKNLWRYGKSYAFTGFAQKIFKIPVA
jgi:hypothetical protein